MLYSLFLDKTLDHSSFNTQTNAYRKRPANFISWRVLVRMYLREMSTIKGDIRDGCPLNAHYDNLFHYNRETIIYIF